MNGKECLKYNYVVRLLSLKHKICPLPILWSVVYGKGRTKSPPKNRKHPPKKQKKHDLVHEQGWYGLRRDLVQMCALLKNLYTLSTMGHYEVGFVIIFTLAGYWLYKRAALMKADWQKFYEKQNCARMRHRMDSPFSVLPPKRLIIYRCILVRDEAASKQRYSGLCFHQFMCWSYQEQRSQFMGLDCSDWCCSIFFFKTKLKFFCFALFWSIKIILWIENSRKTWAFSWNEALHVNIWTWGTPYKFVDVLYVPLLSVLRHSIRHLYETSACKFLWLQCTAIGCNGDGQTTFDLLLISWWLLVIKLISLLNPMWFKFLPGWT